MKVGSTFARSAAESATHRFVIRRSLPPPYRQVKILVSSEGGLKYLRPSLRDIDPELLRLVQQQVMPGSIVWDIGANVGLFCFAAASAAGPGGRVIAIEPDATLITLLRRSAHGNRNLAKVELLAVAVADEVTVRTFNIAARNRATSHLDGYGTSQSGGTRGTELVPAVTLNWLAQHFPLPDILKIDVEEAEVEVLSGAGMVLKHQPTIICEVAAKNSHTVGRILQSHGYAIYDGSLPTLGQSSLEAAAPTTLALPHRR